ncbi:MAG: rhodanese-like domain-containing protein [bacterium]
MTNTARNVLVAMTIVLAVGALIVGNPRASTSGTVDVTALARDIEHEADHVTALELAQWLRDHKSGLRVLDVRSDSEFADFHIPGAEHVALSRLASLKPAGGETIVLYSEGGAHAAQGWVLLRALGFREVYFLRGGLLDWMDDIENPVRAANRTADSAWAHQAELSRYFGGVPRVGAVPGLPSASVGAETAPAATSAVARAKRRGC